MTMQTWRRLRRILWAVAFVGWAGRVVQLVSGADISRGPWTIAYFVFFGLFLLVDTGVRLAERRRSWAQHIPV